MFQKTFRAVLVFTINPLMEKNKTKKTKNTFHCKNTKTCCSKMQNINFVGSRKSLSQGYMFCFNFFFFPHHAKSSISRNWQKYEKCYHRTMMLQHWASSVQSITWIMHQHTGSLSYIKPYLVSTVAFTLQQHCTAFKATMCNI